MPTTLTDEERAYAQEIKHAEPEERIEFVSELMLKSHWYGPESLRTLARVWGIQPGQVRKYSMEARKMYRRSLPTIREQVMHTLENIEFIAADAMRKTKLVKDGDGNLHEYPNPDHGTALRAHETIVRLLAVVGQPTDSEDYRGKSREELLQIAKEKGFALPEKSANEILTEGTSNDRVESPDPEPGATEHSGGNGSADVIRSGRSRRDKDPIPGKRDYLGRAGGRET